MNQKKMHAYVAATLAFLVPAPGRFCYGIILIIALNFFMLMGTLFRSLIKLLKVDDFLPVLTGIFLIFLAVFFRQLLILYSPVNALVLNLSVFMTAISSFLIGYLNAQETKPLKEELSDNMKESGKFSIHAALFFLIRDILSFGTITLPVYSGLKKITLFTMDKNFSAGVFLASVPGAICLSAIMLVILSYINKNLSMTEINSEETETADTESEKSEGAEE